MQFEEQGNFSKAFWLKLVKIYGDKGGIDFMKTQARVSWDRAKWSIDNLTMGGYIKLAAGRPRYELTTLGHRYLNEHPDELKGLFLEYAVIPQTDAEPAQEVAAPASEQAAPKVHSVPTEPVPKLPNPPSNADMSIPRPKPKEQEKVETYPAVARALGVVRYTAADLQGALASYLYDKYADTVTARELIEYLQKKGESPDA
jgi:hypothetical protein